MGDGANAQIEQHQVVRELHAANPVHNNMQHRVENPMQRVGVDAQKSPILRRVPVMPQDNVIRAPRETELRNTYEQINVNFEEAKAAKILQESRKRFEMRRELAAKKRDIREHRVREDQKRTISLKDAVKLDDSKLIKNLGRYKGNESRDYLNLRLNLLENKYHYLLPDSATSRLTRDELLHKLRILYAREQRNPELISYYENLIRIRDTEESLNKKEKTVVPNEARITEKEKKKNKEAFERNKAEVQKSTVSVNEKMLRMSQMEKVMKPDGTAFLKKSNIKISPEKREGIRQILSWMYRNCCKTSESKLGFVHRLASAPPERILLTLYLVENGKQAAPSPEDHYAAINEYVPNLSAFKDQMIASKAKFWKRVGSDAQDSVISWDVLGIAARYALNEDRSPEVKEYADSIGDIRAAEEDLKKEVNSPAEKRDRLMILVQHKGNLLLHLYRSAGLSPDMPPDMIQDLTMRSNVVNLINELAQHMQEVVNITEQLPEDQKEIDPQYRRKDGDEGEGKLKKKSASGGSAMETMGDIKNTLTVMLSGDSGMTAASNAVSSISKATEYGAPVMGLKSINSVLGVLIALNNVVKLAKGTAGLTKADHVGRAMQVSGKLVDSLAGATKTGLSIGEKFFGVTKRFGSAKFGFAGNTQFQTIGETFSTVSGAIQFTAGCASMLAGTALTISGVVQYGRAKSAENDVKRAKDALEERKRQRRELQGQQRPLTKDQMDQESLGKFLKHQERSISDQKSDARIQAISGAVMAASGFLTATGILAPLGGVLGLLSTTVNIGFGLFYSRHRKNLTRKAAVDDFLNLKENIQNVRNANGGLAKLKDDEVLKMMRQEALGELGYATYKECFADLMKQNAHLLYDHVFNKDRNTDADWPMYHDALKSLGMKIKLPGEPGGPMPTEASIYSKLMK